MTNERVKAILLTILILFAMSVGTILTKISFNSISPFTFIWLTLLIAMITLSIYTFVIKKERIPSELMTKKVWFYVFQIGFFNFVLGRFGVLALKYLPVTTKTYMSNFIGFVTMAMSCFILKELPSFYQVLGAVIAFSGLRVFFPEAPQGGEWIGIGLTVLAITSIAYTNNISRKLALFTEKKISNNIISTLAMLMGGSIMVVFCIIVDGFPPVVPTRLDWIAIFYTGTITTAVGLTVWNLILRTLRSYEASILGATTVIWTSILAVIFLNETLEIYQLIGIAMMFVGILLVQVRKKFPFSKNKKPVEIK